MLKVARADSSPSEIAQRILADFMAFRRVPVAQKACDGPNCPICRSVHLPRIIDSVRNGRPVEFVIPAFPGKSPNPEKVLGALPDKAEYLALAFLGELAQRIKIYYPIGIKIILCSDGRVFSDVVGMREDDVSAYRLGIDQIVEELNLTDLVTFSLEEVFGGGDFARMREILMDRHGSTAEELREKVRLGHDASAPAAAKEAAQMYRGITRFLFEDSLHRGQLKSRTSLQRDARTKAYEVILRSNAWSEFIAARFPLAVRLSIHPQNCGSSKLGIRLVGQESWMTPWHGVAVETADTAGGYVLMKRAEAEQQGAELVYSPDGKPSHYKLVAGL